MGALYDIACTEYNAGVLAYTPMLPVTILSQLPALSFATVGHCSWQLFSESCVNCFLIIPLILIMAVIVL